MHCVVLCQALLVYVLQWLCAHATLADTQIHALVRDVAARQDGPSASHSAPQPPLIDSGASTAAAVSSRRVPSVSQLLDWLSLLCDAAVGLLCLGSGGQGLMEASSLVRSVRQLLSQHFHPAASTAKHCHALTKAIQQQQQQYTGRGRGRTAPSGRLMQDTSQAAYSIEYIAV